MSALWELERLAPRHGQGERIALDPAVPAYTVGRSEQCPIRLFSPSASRHHAEIRLGEDGQWWVHLAEGREGLADGEVIKAPCEVCEGLSLQFGADRLRCQRKRDESTMPGIQVPPEPEAGIRRPLIAGLIGLALVLIAAGLLLIERAA